MNIPRPELVIHRVNERARLADIPRHFGAEIDLRAEGSKLVLNHDPFKGGEYFTDWLDGYQHGLLVLNIKEAGIEAEVIRLVEARGIKRFFLLDVEFPYIYRASRAGERRIAMRYSEDEAIETVLNYHTKIDWVWIDSNTRLPLDHKTVAALQGFSTCLVCPERWGRPADIPAYAAQMRKLSFQPSAVMTALSHATTWMNALAAPVTTESIAT
ncbi:hypothetical protein CMV30_12595 [Nibricoccus aquaticus]|uniref:GP-PDE domain-containing protein n=1 Tax=Nibricoccus aquaticus TaxID=2576891 RepID=A0A290QK68_9BACT|nr:hypothetical protein [Nibricoccus aquaticus]ATC64731.1 hypothetical protein CMV30_12595 [Nibricoccus aquaticus]